MMRALLSSAMLVGLAAGPASGQLADAQIVEDGDGARLWLAFSAQPAAVETALDANALTLSIAGVAPEERIIEAAGDTAVGRLVLTPQGGGVGIRLPGRWTRGSAELREGGVLVRLAGPGFVRERAPVGALAAEQGPGARHDPGTSAAAPMIDEARAPVSRSAQTPVSAIGPQALAVAGPCAESGAAVADDAWNLDGLVAHADCLAAAGEGAEAAALYTRVLAFEPSHFDAAMGLGALRAASGDEPGARSLFEQAANAARTDGDALRARAAARQIGEGE